MNHRFTPSETDQLTAATLLAQLEDYDHSLIEDEKSDKTREKYLRDVRKFLAWLGSSTLCKENVIRYKEDLQQNYAPASVNSMLASINSFFHYIGHPECSVRMLKMQREIYCSEEKELSREEYERLLKAAENKPRLYLILETMASTGIRVSELRYFTVEAAKRGEVTVRAKGKLRRILLPTKLQQRLREYCKERVITTGIIFRTRFGNAIDRSNIWSDMKKLCEKAGVDPSKVFPHNLRKLFARAFYALERDIAKVADVLGHSSINTTRIYIIFSGIDHRRLINKLKLVH